MTQEILTLNAQHSLLFKVQSLLSFLSVLRNPKTLDLVKLLTRYCKTRAPADVLALTCLARGVLKKGFQKCSTIFDQQQQQQQQGK